MPISACSALLLRSALPPQQGSLKIAKEHPPPPFPSRPPLLAAFWCENSKGIRSNGWTTQQVPTLTSSVHAAAISSSQLSLLSRAIHSSPSFSPNPNPRPNPNPNLLIQTRMAPNSVREEEPFFCLYQKHQRMLCACRYAQACRRCPPTFRQCLPACI